MRAWCAVPRSCRQRRLEQAAELAREVHRHPGMHRTLLVEEALLAAPGEHPFVPDARMDVQALVAREAEADEALRRDVVAGQCQGHVERRLVEREEQLAAVGVVV